MRCSDSHDCIDRRPECSCVLGDQASHRMSDDHDGVVDPVQIIDQVDQAARRGGNWAEDQSLVEILGTPALLTGAPPNWCHRPFIAGSSQAPHEDESLTHCSGLPPDGPASCSPARLPAPTTAPRHAPLFRLRSLTWWNADTSIPGLASSYLTVASNAGPGGSLDPIDGPDLSVGSTCGRAAAAVAGSRLVQSPWPATSASNGKVGRAWQIGKVELYACKQGRSDRRRVRQGQLR